MTPNQSDLIARLVEEKDTTSLSETQRTFLVSGVNDALTFDQASRVITALLALPRKRVVETGTVEVPEGRYAVVNAAGVTEFFKVDCPTDGKWAGFVFVKQQASDDLYPVKGARKNEVLARIAADPDALARYGQELGCCGRCGRTLTDEVSRATGIGPECAKILGLSRPSADEVTAAPMWDGVGPAELDEYGDVVGPAPVAPVISETPSVVDVTVRRKPAGLGWRERKAAVKAQQSEGLKLDTTPRPSSQLLELPGESWEDIFA